MFKSSKHGTACNLGQFAEISATVTKALPKALEGINPRDLLKVLQSDGEGLSATLNGVLKSFILKGNTPLMSRVIKVKVYSFISEKDIINADINVSVEQNIEESAEVLMCWVRFSFGISTAEAIIKMKELNLRPANIFELVAFGRIDYDFSPVLVGLGAPVEKRNVKGFCAVSHGKLCFFPMGYDLKWPAETYFAAVEIEQEK